MTCADRNLMGQGSAKAISDSDWQAGMLRCLIGLGQDLGIQTMAEGIETVGQLHVLDALGCDCGQGYLISQPMHPSDVLAFIANWPADREIKTPLADAPALLSPMPRAA